MKKLLSGVGIIFGMFFIIGCGSKEEVTLTSKYSQVITSNFNSADDNYNYKAKVSDDFFLKAESIVNINSSAFQFDIDYQNFVGGNTKKTFSYGALPLVNKKDKLNFISGSLTFDDDKEISSESYQFTYYCAGDSVVLNDKFKETLGAIGCDATSFEKEMNNSIKSGKGELKDDKYDSVFVCQKEGSLNKIIILSVKESKY